MIYKQVIPPAPAYMGLNLFLKGQQLASKSVSKREKYRDDLRTIRSSHSVQKAKQSTIPIPTAGPVIVDFIECLNMRKKNSLVVPPTLGEIRKLNGAIMLKKSNPSSNLIKLNSNNKYLNIRSSITRTQYKSCETNDKNARTEFVRRHASCLPKHNHTLTTDDILTSMSEPNAKLAKKDLECVGNKCLEKIEWDINNNITSNSMNLSSPSSSRMSLEQIFKSKSAPSITRHLQSVRKFQNNQFNHHCNLKPQNQESNTNPNSPIKNGLVMSKNVKTNIFAVGLSVKAWRAKFNKIMKAQKENVNRQLTVARRCSP